MPVESRIRSFPMMWNHRILQTSGVRLRSVCNSGSNSGKWSGRNSTRKALGRRQSRQEALVLSQTRNGIRRKIPTFGRVCQARLTHFPVLQRPGIPVAQHGIHREVVTPSALRVVSSARLPIVPLQLPLEQEIPGHLRNPQCRQARARVDPVLALHQPGQQTQPEGQQCGRLAVDDVTACPT